VLIALPHIQADDLSSVRNGGHGAGFSLWLLFLLTFRIVLNILCGFQYKSNSYSPIMPTESKYPLIDIPKTDLWGFLFERKDKEYPDDKGTRLLHPHMTELNY